LLKLDPKNTELLKQKQDILNSSIATTEEKLKQLKEIKDEADKKMAEGTKINEENYRALQREIINTQNKLNTLKTEASGWNKAGKKLEEYGQKLEDLGTKADKVANKMTVGLTVPIVAGYTAMTKSAIETETAVQQVERIYGEAAESIKEFAESKALDYNMSASDAYKYSQIYGNLIQSITDDQQENAEQTQKLLQASSVIASATGRSMEDVMDRIRSGLLGNTEAIEDLGVNVNVALLETTDAFKQIAGDKSWDKLTFQEQQQIRLLGILEQTSKKYGDEVQDNTASSIQKLTAKTKNLTNDLGKKLLPIANKVLDKANDLVDGFNNLSDEQKDNIVKIGLMVAAAGPLLKVAGTAVTVTGKVTKGIGNITEAIGVASGKMTSTETSVNNLANVFKATFSPTGLAVIGITAAVGIIVNELKKAEEETKAKFETMGKSATDFYDGIQNAEGYLDNFNSTLFATTEEQQELQEQMDEIQAGITKICKTASDERRGYTEEEIIQLDEYFKKLRELKDREIAIQQEIAGAITQQAVTNAETFQGSLEEYKVQSQEWIATAQQQAEATINLIEQGTIEEVALLNQKYGEEATMQNEAYATEYNNLMTQKQAKIDAANAEVAEVMSAYAQGYANRANQDGDFYEHIQHYNWEQEQENQRHADKIKEIGDYYVNNVAGRNLAEGSENEEHYKKQKKIWENMYKNMSESEAEQLGVWIAMLANTEMYGGEISEENQQMVDTMLESYDSMPKKTREAMENAMSPMLEEMKNSEPSLYAKASGIADGILSRLKKSFDIHSPSRETRDIFQNVMKGAELGLEDEQKALNKQVDDIANQMKTNFSNMVPNMGAIKQSVIDQTKTVFTTPTIVINAQDELTPHKINTIIDTVNRRLGSKY
jgi:phage-related minor tail protein